MKINTEETHEVAVGPIHAGIIEPGHFRFTCSGETVLKLDIQLGYQHRNIEKLFLQQDKPLIHLAESIAGDTVIGHALAHCCAIEALSNTQPSNKAEIIRIIALEMERMAVHIGDLGAICGDIAYLMGSAVFGATRTLVINTTLEICGNRFGRGLVRPSGVVFDIDEKLAGKILAMLDKVLKNVKRMADVMFSSTSVLSRLEKTGIVTHEQALEIGMVGLPARASGVSVDVRSDNPWGWYKNYRIDKRIMYTGDVYARAYLRYEEIRQSGQIIRDLLAQLSEYRNEPLLTRIHNPLAANSKVVAMVEGWRGEIKHTVSTDESGKICEYKVKDPSQNNWQGLAVAMKGGEISDFPLCNKSFNLSYCGNDL